MIAHVSANGELLNKISYLRQAVKQTVSWAISWPEVMDFPVPPGVAIDKCACRLTSHTHLCPYTGNAHRSQHRSESSTLSTRTHLYYNQCPAHSAYGMKPKTRTHSLQVSVIISQTTLLIHDVVQVTLSPLYSHSLYVHFIALHF